MKKQNLLFKSLTFIMLTTIISCSNKPNDEKIKRIILEFEKDKETSKIYLSSPCDTGNTLSIPKNFVLSYSPTDDTIITQQQKNQKEIMDNLAEKGVIRMREFHLGCKKFEKKYVVIVYDLGNKILNGENAENYILNLYYLDDINLINTERISKDAIDVFYQLNLTPVYKALNRFCSKQQKNNSFQKNDTISKRIVYKNDEWVLQ